MYKYRISNVLFGKQFSLLLLVPDDKNILGFVKIISLKSDNCALALRKRLFCDAKPTLLPYKTAAFGMQNNRFCNVLITRELHNRFDCEKCLHLSGAFLSK